jgi:hypothetical protein
VNLDEEGREAELDMIALLGCATADDGEGIGAIIDAANIPMLIGALMALVIRILEASGVDPAEWVRGRSEALRREMQDGPA